MIVGENGGLIFDWSMFAGNDALVQLRQLGLVTFYNVFVRRCVCVCGVHPVHAQLVLQESHTHTHKHPGDDRKHGKATSLYVSELNCPLAYPSIQDSRWPHCRCRLCTKYQMWSFVSQVDQVLQNFVQCSAVGVSRSNDTIQA